MRSALAASVSNPAGQPEWTQSARVAQTYGPFQDTQGVLHWVDLLLFTASLTFAYAGASSPFGVFPIREFLFPPPSPTDLNLGSGSVWFLANLLASSLPQRLYGGCDHRRFAAWFRASFVPKRNLYGPRGATLTLKATLAPLAAPANHGGPGGNTLAAKLRRPAHVTLNLRSQRNIHRADRFRCHGYSSTVHLTGTSDANQPGGLPLVLIPSTRMCRF